MHTRVLFNTPILPPGEAVAAAAAPAAAAAKFGGGIRVLVGVQVGHWSASTAVHTVAVTAVDAAGFNATVARVDRLGEGWADQLRLSYVAFVEQQAR